MYWSIPSTSPKCHARHVTMHSVSMQMLDKDLFWLSFVIFVMFFKMQGCGMYEKEDLKGGLALNIFSKQ